MLTDKITAIHGDPQMTLRRGRIDACAGDGLYHVSTGQGHFTTQRAFSCIVEPQAGDSVLFSIDERNQGHILAVLERAGKQSTALDFPADVTIRADSGRVHVDANKGVGLSSREGIDLLADKVSVHAKTGLLNIANLRTIGQSLVAQIEHVQSYAHTLESVADQLVQKLKNSFRRIEVLDQVKSHDSIHTVENLYSVKSKQAAILAEKDIKVDAERIHMG
jgi:hypothetical protein